MRRHRLLEVLQLLVKHFFRFLHEQPGVDVDPRWRLLFQYIADSLVRRGKGLRRLVLLKLLQRANAAIAIEQQAGAIVSHGINQIEGDTLVLVVGALAIENEVEI